jgi:hypothetical protein
LTSSFSRQQIVLLCLFFLLSTVGFASAETRTGTIGDIIPLSGTAPGVDVIYLFMTGPGVPQYGSRMDSSVSPVITGDPDTFTQVPVKGDRWNYSWQTGRVSGGLAPGPYTVYASTAPAAADALSGIPYSGTEIFLSQPVTTGTLLISSVPPGAQVEVNWKYSGNTPLDLPSLPPGMYGINISLPGYVPATKMVNLSAGETKQVSVELETSSSPTPSPDPQFTTISPPQATTAIPTSPTSANLPGLIVIAGIITGLIMSVLIFRK